MQYTLNNGASQRHLTRDIGPSVRICQLNIEGFSKSKSEYLSRILLELNIDVAVIQETHCTDEANLLARGKLIGYNLIAAQYHHAYGTATYVKNSIDNAEFIEASERNNIFTTTIDIGGLKISNIYKPPSVSWPADVLPVLDHPGLYVGDFNSHHNLWGYQSNDENGIQLNDWCESNNMFLVFDAKDKGTFHSGRWQRDYNPDLCFVTTNPDYHPIHTSRKVLNDFPHSQHRPVIYECGIKIPVINSIQKPR